MPTRRNYSFIYWLHIGIMIPALVATVAIWVNFLITPSMRAMVAENAITWIVFVLVGPLTVLVGFWCLRRSRGNVVGALLVIWGCGSIQIVLNNQDAQFPLWYQTYGTFYAAIVWATLFNLVAYFPDGHIVPKRWKKWVDRLVTLTYSGCFLYGFSLQRGTFQTVDNPLHIAALAPLSSFLFSMSAVAMFATIAIGLRSLILRFRRKEQPTRQQIKWLLWGTVPLILLGVTQLFVGAILESSSQESLFVGKLSQVYVFFLPVIAVGNAILRHRLYDIDIIIRKTLIYSVLSVILAVIYFGGVIFVQQIFRAATGETSDLAIVVSTLLIAALFSPLRRRVQDVIDRRFYRRKYDVEQTLAQFQQNLRDEVDVETLKANLIGVVGDTMQPDKIALWVRVPNLRDTKALSTQQP